MSKKKSFTRKISGSPLQLWLAAQLFFWGTNLAAVVADLAGLPTLGLFSPQAGAMGEGFVVTMLLCWLASFAILVMSAVAWFRRQRSPWIAFAAAGMVAGTAFVTLYGCGVLMLGLALLSGQPH
ncbi:MAG: hypothetical protein AAFY88_23895 [Acidobacteriota bacterium]